MLEKLDFAGVIRLLDEVMICHWQWL